MLSSESSPEPGPWRTDSAPFLREIMDAITDPTVERVTFQKPAQIGWTEVVGNTVGYFMDQDPCPILIMQPTVDLAKVWSRERLDPMLRDTPRLHGKVVEGNRREKSQSILRKTFANGYAAITGANSAAGVRSRPVRVLIGDERDAYPISAKGSAKKNNAMGATGEGDPFSLGIKRTTRFWNRKILEGSTPTVKGASPIERARLQSSDAEYFIPCAHCGFEQTLKWSHLRYEPGQPETAAYLCGEITKDGELAAGCGKLIPNAAKMRMLLRGRWVHKHPERTRWRGYWINALYMPWFSWENLVREWFETEGNREELKVFVNTRLAETWNDEGERVSESVLEARREHYKAEVPMRAAVLTAGVDVQGDRLEVKVKGWGAGEESWRIHYEVLWGDPAEAEVWRQLDLILRRKWQHESGRLLRIRAMAVDSGGHHTDHVYRYCAARRRLGVWAIKGEGTPGRAAVTPPAKKSRQRLWILGTTALKDIIFARLRRDTQGPGFMHFSHDATPEYFRQLTGERCITAYISRRPFHKYVPIEGRRQEALDCEQYALAALYILGPVRDRLGAIAAKLKVDNAAAAAEAQEAAAEPQAPAVKVPPKALRRPPKGRTGGWFNSWRG